MRLIENLRIPNDVGWKLTSASHRLSEKEVVELIHDQTRRFLNADSMYVALFDEERKLLPSPLLSKMVEREN